MIYQCTHDGWTKRVCQECDKKQLDVIRDARSLSSGTIAGLINDSSYDEIEKAQQSFIVWLTKADRLFENWRVAWDAFINEEAA